MAAEVLMRFQRLPNCMGRMGSTGSILWAGACPPAGPALLGDVHVQTSRPRAGDYPAGILFLPIGTKMNRPPAFLPALREVSLPCCVNGCLQCL